MHVAHALLSLQHLDFMEVCWVCGCGKAHVGVGMLNGFLACFDEHGWGAILKQDRTQLSITLPPCALQLHKKKTATKEAAM